MDLQLYTIMPLDTNHLEEICQDIRYQYENGTATCALFKMTLVPEGNPPVDKVGAFCAKFDLFRDRLREMGLGCGILVQATMGHGWVLSEMFPFQPYTSLETGNQPQIVCPMDEGFRAYCKHIFAVIAAHHPDTVMLDDDFRLLSYREGGGCGCPLHVAAFNEAAAKEPLLAGQAYTRENIWELLHRKDEVGDLANKIMISLENDALLGCARGMREGMDSVDPTLPGTFCCVGNNVECAEEIAKILAGKGNPSVVRINNGNYTPAGARYFSNVFFRAAQSIAKLQGKVDVILAETDTCPQNRYSTGAMSLHTHFTGTVLEGATGAKHWITRLSAFEPESGRMYRKVLGKHSGFYRTLADLVPTLTWRGCRIPTMDKAVFDFRRSSDGSNGWSFCVLERFGLPMYFSPKTGGITCLEGVVDAALSDDQIREILSGPVFLASDAAKRLIDRGFGAYLGVDVRDWKGPQPSYEILPFRKNRESMQVRYKELVPTSAETVEHSTVYHGVDGAEPIRLFPGVTVYKNSLGGTVATFCGTPRTSFTLTEAFSFLNYSRKLQLIELMQAVGQLPIYSPEDAEIYLRAADMPDGRLFCAVFNIGLDPIDALPLCVDRPVTKIEKLQPDGTFAPIGFTKQADGTILTDTPAYTLDPVVLVLS